MTAKQLAFYRRLWGDAKKVLRARGMSPSDAEAQRHVIHREVLGEDKSSLDLTNAEFDRVKGAFLAISKPAEMDVQIVQMEMPATRLRVALRRYLAAMDEGEEYAETIVLRMNGNGRLAPRGSTLGDLGDEAVQKVIFAVKDECRRRWPKIADLRSDVWDWMDANVTDPQAAARVICEALNVRVCPEIGRLYYEPLLMAFGALKLALKNGAF